MKRLFAALCCCALLTQTVVAQETATKEAKQGKHAKKEMRQNDGKAAAKQEFIGCKKIVGTYVYGTDGESVGDINSVTLDKNGNVHCAIVGIGGVAGVGETEIAVPWEVFQCECKMEDEKKTCKVKLPMTAEQLEKAPALKKEEYAELYDPKWVETNSKFYGIKTAAKVPKKGSMMCVTDIAGLQLSGDKAMKTASNKSPKKTYTKAKPDAKSDMKSEKESEEMADLGTIEEVVIDLNAKKVCYVVVGDDSGLLSENHVAIPFKTVKFSKKDGDLCAKVAATSKDLEAATKITPGEYQELDKKSVRKQIDAGFKTR